MNRGIFFFSVTCIFIFFTAPAMAAEYYVDFTKGSQAGDCSQEQPCRTFNAAGLDGVAPGDTVNVTGTYDNTVGTDIQLAWSGTLSQPITVQAWDGESVPVIDGSTGFMSEALNISGDFLHVIGFDIYSANGRAVNVGVFEGDATAGVRIEKCNIFGENDVQYAGAIAVNNSTEVEINYNYFEGNYTGLGINNSSYIQIDGNIFYGENSSNTAIAIGMVDNFQLSNNIIYSYNPADDPNTTGFGLFMTDINNSVIVHNTFSEVFIPIATPAGKAGISGTHMLQNNNFDCGTAGTFWGVIDMTGAGTDGVPDYLDALQSDYNNIYMCAFSYIDGDGQYIPYVLNDWKSQPWMQDAHSMSVDPLYESIESGAEDFSLKENSMLIDAGVDLSSIVDTDFEGDPRPYALGYDIGADEYYIAAPDTPKNFTVTERKPKKMSLEWQSDCDDCTFAVVYSTDTDFSDYDTANGTTANEVTLTGLPISKKIYMKLRAENGGEVSEDTDVISARTKPAKAKIKKIADVEGVYQVYINKNPRIKKMVVRVWKKKSGKWSKIKTFRKKKGLKKATVKVNLVGITRAGKYKVTAQGVWNAKNKGAQSEIKKLTID